MLASVATATATTTKPKPRQGSGGRNRGSGGRRGGGPAQRKMQNDPAPTESTDAADTPATPITTTPTAVENTDATSQDDNTGICLICAEPVKYYSVSECNHRTCHICAVRLRILYKRQDCILCKVHPFLYVQERGRVNNFFPQQEPQHSLIFTTSSTATFTSFRPSDIPYKDAQLSIFFETHETMEDTLILLRFNCPGENCNYVASGWGNLKLHVRGVHGNLMWYECFPPLEPGCGLNHTQQRSLYTDKENIHPRTCNISSRLAGVPPTIYPSPRTATKAGKPRHRGSPDVRVLS
jgi:hypothetical protein